MHTYTLAEVDHLNKQAQRERKDIFAFLDNSSLTLEEKITLGGSENLRKGDVVAMWHNYGGDYPEGMARLFETMLQNSILDAPSEKRYGLGLLSWVQMTGMFGKDVKKELLDVGYAETTASALSDACMAAKGNVGLWWQALSPEGKEVLERYIDSCASNYTPGWPHNNKKASHATLQLG